MLIWVTTFIAISLSVCQAQDRTPTGFYYPRSQNIGPYSGFLASGCFGHKDYFPNEYHLGKDSWGYMWEPVYATASGEVIWRSKHGWSPDRKVGDETMNINVGLLILHYTSTGQPFQALYGHIRTRLQPGQSVSAGEIIGYVGDWFNQQHVHFGVRIPPSAQPRALPVGDWGRPNCDTWSWGIGSWIEPMGFIQSNSPQ